MLRRVWILDDALGVPGVRDGTEPEEDERDRRVHQEVVGQQPTEEHEADRRVERAVDRAGTERDDEHDPRDAEERGIA